jgi:midasin (ATPase involved in ribosome maturation)
MTLRRTGWRWRRRMVSSSIISVGGIITEMKQIYPRPILFLGHTGWGKSFIARHVARGLGVGFNQFNSHPGMDMSVLVGMWRPIPVEGGVSIIWQDGIITDAVRMGKILLAEEHQVPEMFWIMMIS